MQISKTSIGHEILILFLYIILSPFFFLFSYDGQISGDGGIAFVLLICVAVLTAVISVIIISIIRRFYKENKAELAYGIIPLTLSIIFYILIFQGSADSKDFIVGSSTELIVLYGMSIFYKLHK